MLGWVSLVLLVALVAAGSVAGAPGRGPTRRPRVPVVLGRRLGARRTHLAGAGRGGLAGRRTSRGRSASGTAPGCCALCALAVASVAGYGAATLLRRLPPAARPGRSRSLLVLLPSRCCPDAAFGVSGRLTTGRLPGRLQQRRAALQQAHDDGAAGDVLVLPAEQLPAAVVEPRPQGARPARSVSCRSTTWPATTSTSTGCAWRARTVELARCRAALRGRATRRSARPGWQARDRLRGHGEGRRSVARVAATTLLDRPTLTVQQLAATLRTSRPAWLDRGHGVCLVTVPDPAARGGSWRRLRRRANRRA